MTSGSAGARIQVEVRAMKPLMKRALLFAGVLVLVCGVPAAAGGPPAGKVKHVQGWIGTIAMDGPRVVYDTEGVLPGIASAKVYVWDVRTGAATLIKSRNPNADPIGEIAIAGTRIAWIARGATAADPNSEVTEELSVTSLTTPRIVRSLGSAFRSEHQPVEGDAYGYEGDWIGGLVGSKALLAVGRWSTSGPGTLTRGELDTIGRGGLARRVSGSGSIVSESTDGFRIAVLRSTDAWPVAGELRGTTRAASVGVYSSAGSLIREINATTAEGIALSGSNLVVLTKTRTIDVYNWRSGRLVHSWRVPSVGTAHLEDAYANIAVYSIYSHGRNLHALQLSTGKDALLTKGSALLYYNGQGRGAQLEAPGLVYAVDKGGEKAVAKLVFVPMARVLAAVSKGRAPSRAQLVASAGRAAAPKKNGDILFGSIRVGNGSRLLYLMSPNGTHQRRLGTARNVWSPAWSPGGKWIAYGSTPRNGGLCPRLYVMRADGTHVRRLTHDRSCYLNPTWAPGGKRIAFDVWGGPATAGIWTMNLDGSDRRLLTDKGASPAWSPDGSAIVFRSKSPEAIWLMDADGSNLRQLTTPTDRPRARDDSDIEPAWSFNGKWIAFSRQHPVARDWQRDIFVVRSDGNGLRQLTSQVRQNTKPAWSPDGTRIAFVSDRAHRDLGDIYVMKADGTGQKRLTRNVDNQWPDWGPRH
jgi:Tol biopolymer transport system component